jgi:ATP-dependent DNA helicase RecG
LKLRNEITYLSGVGPKRAELLQKELNIFTFKDLLYYFPYKYIDRSRFYRIAEITSTTSHIQVKGKFTRFETIGPARKQRYIAYFSDGESTIELLWFKGVKWIKESLKPGTEYVIFGKPGIYNKKLNFIHPDVEIFQKDQFIDVKLQPYYSTTERLRNNFLNSKTIQKLQLNLLKIVEDDLNESLPDYLLKFAKLTNLREALFNIHFPKNNDLLESARFRLKFEELFLIQLKLLKSKNERKHTVEGFRFSKVGDFLNTFYKENLPFELTGAQKRVIKEIRSDIGNGQQMNRLLQGDVGSGKTLVALMSMLIALDNNYQCCLMAPTEILANQHFVSISRFLANLNIKIDLLSGSTRKTKREKIHEALLNGELQILIGTHALIEDVVQFKNLGLIVIDEQHRFGVAQRARLWNKNIQPPHVLVMTATPIPRTLAMTIYGDLDVSVIDELPPGRKPIQTRHLFDAKRLELFGFMKKQIAAGRQIYIVYPLIKESEKLDYKDLEDGYESMVRAFPLPEYKVSIVHGKMKAKDKAFEMQRFVKGETHIMVATTVIEVGVDVPNASVMIIESAERFGLSQLHQLRGRVGRGAEQSYCVLMTSFKLSAESRRRVEIMVQTNDGFEIAEADLRLRGPGDIEGTKQSGIAFDLKIASFGKDGQILQYSREIASKILEKDPLLENTLNKQLNKLLDEEFSQDVDWGTIS